MSKIRVAVVGAGSMGLNHLRTYSNINDVELVGVYDINAESAVKAAKQFNCVAFDKLEDFIGKVDAVSVVTPSITHHEVGMFFLKNGIDCMMEKPLAATEKQCEELIKTAEKSKAVLMVGHIERFNPAVQKLSEILGDGKTIQAIETHRMSESSGRITDVDVAMDLMIHDVEVVMSMVQSPVVSVSAKSFKSQGDHITALISFENGAYAACTASRITKNRIRSMHVTSEQGFFELDFVNQKLAIHHQGRNPAMKGGGDFNVAVSTENLYIPSANALSLELQSFIDSTKTRKTPKITGQNALDALQVIWKVQEDLK